MAVNSRFVELYKKTKEVDASNHFKLLHVVKYVLYLVLSSTVFVRKLFFTIKTLIFIVIVYYCVTVKVHIINRTLHGSSKIWILCSRVKNNVTRSLRSLVRYCSCHSNMKFICFPQPCNILYIFYQNVQKLTCDVLPDDHA